MTVLQTLFACEAGFLLDPNGMHNNAQEKNHYRWIVMRSFSNEYKSSAKEMANFPTIKLA